MTLQLSIFLQKKKKKSYKPKLDLVKFATIFTFWYILEMRTHF